ncbi:MAG: hypothetical protein ABIO48_05895 [Pedococcus sp.]
MASRDHRGGHLRAGTYDGLRNLTQVIAANGPLEVGAVEGIADLLGADVTQLFRH